MGAAMALPKHRADHSRGEPLGGDIDWRTRYDIENLTDVDAYVDRFPSLAPILAQAPRQIATAFGEDIRLILRSEVDPEDETAIPYLVVDILMRQDVEDVLARLYRFEDIWWLDAMPRDGATIVFMPRCS
jgi:hypothetical protein